jgi:serine/threonine protein kinase
MSLEQLRGDKEVDPRTDVYAFGVILYEALSGRHPYDATTLSELAIKVATVPPVPLKELCPELPTALTRVVDWAIAKQPNARLASVRAMIRELEPFAQEYSLRNELTNLEATSPRLPIRKLLHSIGGSEGHGPRPMAATRRSPDTFTARELPATPARRTRRGWLWLALGGAVASASMLGWWTYRTPQLAVEPYPIAPTVDTSRAKAAVARAKLPSELLSQVASQQGLTVEANMTTLPLEPSAPPAEPNAGATPLATNNAAAKAKHAARLVAQRRRATEQPPREPLRSSTHAADLLGF